ncbi:hypothetical protein N7G274_007224 [Stereocaulon virgatum]|uniref:Uncharacterized protein n=1 Tax=Stereocaulon virgatum TaxID=373712 RepID=A0ABR4A1I6_9LECA
MLSVDRALTSRLLATSKIIKWPTTSARHRSDHSSGKRWTMGRQPPNRPGGLREPFLNPDPQSSDLAARARFLETKNFVPWLVERLQTLEKNAADPGYATFARNLMAILPDKSIRTALDNQESTHPKDSEWQPSEQTRPLPLLRSLRSAYNFNGEAGVDLQLRYAYHGLLAARKFSKVDLQDQGKLADLRYPV